jgi:hypothetical protein
MGGGMNRRSLDLYRQELLKKERELDRREERIVERESRHSQLRSHLARASGDVHLLTDAIDAARAELTDVKLALGASREEASRLAQAEKMLEESLEELRKEVANPVTFEHRSSVWVSYRQRLRDARDEILAARPASGLNSLDLEVARLVVLGMLAMYGYSDTERAVRKGRTLTEIAELPRNRLVPRPESSDLEGLGISRRSTQGGGFARY